MVETVQAHAFQTARRVDRLTAHVAVMLVGWGLTVALVISSIHNNFTLYKIVIRKINIRTCDFNR